jgi:hypothetical protein
MTRFSSGTFCRSRKVICATQMRSCDVNAIRPAADKVSSDGRDDSLHNDHIARERRPLSCRDNSRREGITRDVCDSIWQATKRAITGILIPCVLKVPSRVWQLTSMREVCNEHSHGKADELVVEFFCLCKYESGWCPVLLVARSSLMAQVRPRQAKKTSLNSDVGIAET